MRRRPWRARIAARSITFSNSRTLPGQSYCIRRRTSPSVSRSSRLSLRPSLCTKCAASSGMSSRRSRSGTELDREYVEPEIEVLAESAAPHLLLEVAIGRRDHAHVDGAGALFADALEIVLLAARAGACPAARAACRRPRRGTACRHRPVRTGRRRRAARRRTRPWRGRRTRSRTARAEWSRN